MLRARPPERSRARVGPGRTAGEDPRGDPRERIATGVLLDGVAMACRGNCCGGVHGSGVVRVPAGEAPGDRPAQNAYIQKISSRMPAVLKAEMADHVHCAFFRKKEKTVPSPAEMEKELGPSYQGLLPAVAATIPDGYRIVMAHHCSYQTRQFVHLTLENDGNLISLVIARKQDGESFAGLAPTATHDGIPMYQSAAGRFQVAGFEAGQFLAYIVSDLKGKANLEVASALAPRIHELLMKTPP
jgi:hypothetical protein